MKDSFASVELYSKHSLKTKTGLIITKKKHICDLKISRGIGGRRSIERQYCVGRLYDSTPYQESIKPEPASTPLILRTETIMTFENYPSPQPGDKGVWRGWSNKLRGNYVHLYLPSSSDQSSITSQGTLNSGTSNQHPHRFVELL